MTKHRSRLFKAVPNYLVDASNIVINVSFSVLFAITFLTIYSPFSTTAWFHVGNNTQFMWTAAFVMISTTFLVLSRSLMHAVRKKILFYQYILWLLIEIVLIGLFHAFLTIQVIGLEDFSKSYIVYKSIFITLVALGTPYAITDLLIALNDTRKMLNLTNTNAVVSDGEAFPQDTRLINITDNNGNLKLSIKIDNLFYIKSEDNYIKVYYSKKGEIHNYMLRCKLKTIEDNFVKNSPLMRCHRCYIVNTEKVKILRNESEGFFIDFDREGVEDIPVSKTYTEQFVAKFSHKTETE